jgi:uncharacterized cupin superfamily protein
MITATPFLAAAAVFPRGWAGTWQIHETIRKLRVLF